LGGGGNIGEGKQGFSWISINDCIRGIVYILENNHISGPVNLSAPTSSTNADFTVAMGKAFNMPTLLTLPARLMKVLGELADEVMLEGQTVVPKKLIDSNFVFEDTDIIRTVKKLIG